MKVYKLGEKIQVSEFIRDFLKYLQTHFPEEVIQEWGTSRDYVTRKISYFYLNVLF
jgi:hypothetical protein